MNSPAFVAIRIVRSGYSVPGRPAIKSDCHKDLRSRQALAGTQRQTVAIDVLAVGLHHARSIIAPMSDVAITTGPACPLSRNSASSLRI
jgi:hypothetical protein